MSLIKKFGKNLKRLREERKMTQAQLAEKSDLSTATVARLEAGVGFFTCKTVEKLSQGLNISEDELFIFPQLTNNRQGFIEEVARLSAKITNEDDYELILQMISAFCKRKA